MNLRCEKKKWGLKEIHSVKKRASEGNSMVDGGRFVPRAPDQNQRAMSPPASPPGGEQQQEEDWKTKSSYQLHPATI